MTQKLETLDELKTASIDELTNIQLEGRIVKGVLYTKGEKGFSLIQRVSGENFALGMIGYAFEGTKIVEIGQNMNPFFYGTEEYGTYSEMLR